MQKKWNGVSKLERKGDRKHYVRNDIDKAYCKNQRKHSCVKENPKICKKKSNRYKTTKNDKTASSLWRNNINKQKELLNIEVTKNHLHWLTDQFYMTTTTKKRRGRFYPKWRQKEIKNNLKLKKKKLQELFLVISHFLTVVLRSLIND